MADLDTLLRVVLRPEALPAGTDSLAAWWAAVPRPATTTPIDRAIAAGAHADRIGFAFAAGYAEALRALLPALPAGAIAALCATEEGGAHPRAIQTRLAPTGHPPEGRFAVTGAKSWATLADAAQALLVVASIGADAQGRNRLRVVRVPAAAPGVRIEPAPAPFIPEITHARVTFDAVAVGPDDVLPGDGYDDYLKPFRTIEDLHVHGALAGYLVAIARRHDLGPEVIERLLALIVAVRGLAAADPKRSTTHLALAGLLALASEVVAEVERRWRPGDERVRWERDRALLQVAGKARAARRERAWAVLAAP